MATRPHSAADLHNALDAVRAHGSISAAARALGVPVPTFASRVARAKQTLGADPSPSLPTAPGNALRVHGNSGEVDALTPQRVRTLADLVRVCEIDEAEWEIERWVCNKWDQAAKGPDDKPVVTELYQVKAWLKRKVAVLAARDEIAALITDAKKAIPPRPFKVAAGSKGGPLLEINISDLHIGKLAWGDETGWEHYDSGIAERLHDTAVDTILERVAAHTFARVVLVMGNDLLHSDTKAGTTTAGTKLDMDSRWHRSYLIARQMLTRAVDRLAAHVAPVTVLAVPGNHDTLATFCLGDALACYYHKTKGVTVDNAPTMRKYLRHGRVMLMFTHGNTGKLADYPLLMATEQPEMWAATEFREAHTGDKHQLRVQEHKGVRVRILPALCPPDAWHSEHHFVGMQRSTEAFVWHPDEGLIGTAVYTVPRER